MNGSLNQNYIIVRTTELLSIEKFHLSKRYVRNSTEKRQFVQINCPLSNIILQYSATYQPCEKNVNKLYLTEKDKIVLALESL